MSDDGKFPELERIAALMRRFPQLGRAITADNPAIAVAREKAGPQDALFLTKATDSPGLLVEGFVDEGGTWRIWCLHLIKNPAHEGRVAEEIADQADAEYLSPVDGVSELILRWSIRYYLLNGPLGEDRTAFEKRLAASRFAPDLTLH
jgi:hypothetical protein